MSWRDMAKNVVDGAASLLKAAEERAAPGAVVLDGFPRSIQLDRHACGAHCAFAILQYFGKARSFSNVKRAAGTTLDGTDQWSIRELFLQRGLKPKRINMPTVAKIRREIDRGNPILISMDNEEHWAVVYGYGRGCVFVADPSVKRAPRCLHSTAKFRKRWDRWAMAVRP